MCTAKAGSRIAFHRMIQIREAKRITKKEDRCVVANDVPISFLGIELHCKTVNVPLRIRCSAFPGDARKTREHRRPRSNLGKNRSLGVLCDVVSSRESSMRAPTLGMHPAFRNNL